MSKYGKQIVFFLQQIEKNLREKPGVGCSLTLPDIMDRTGDNYLYLMATMNINRNRYKFVKSQDPSQDGGEDPGLGTAGLSSGNLGLTKNKSVSITKSVGRP